MSYMLLYVYIQHSATYASSGQLRELWQAYVSIREHT